MATKSISKTVLIHGCEKHPALVTWPTHISCLEGKLDFLTAHRQNRVKGILASILGLASSWITYCEEKTSFCIVRLTCGEDQVSELGFRTSKACQLPHNLFDSSSSLSIMTTQTQLTVWLHFQSSLNHSCLTRQHL